MGQEPTRHSVYSTISAASQTVVPAEVRERLGLQPGDTLRYRLSPEGVILDKARLEEVEDPFAIFTEWSSEADEKAYADL
ncbi:MAG: AbrB family transcriptional regulator [Rhodoplanes sp.]|uniref:AbrB/MazE/SpoVT family DNA-binding domain-containing protein n=1 Tax=Rhodoplanes sp. TaxID=1968906 RepID=UPI0018494F69|nr:AbrB/MazE/SpoVT family DNA-binding domain-containing protein [Rhodoplanes sp.]NVO12894.1 AbrB family transcriptional regulator [Rhodoplanes sp.]